MLRFTLYDFTNDDGLTPIEVNEPIGFDALILNLQRHQVYRGINFEYSLNTIQFADTAGINAIKNAYEKDGIEANVILKVEFACEDNYDLLFESNLNFETYKDLVQDYCSIEIGLEPSSDIATLKKNEDVKVDLETLKGFDGVTNLEPYEYLGKEITLPSKTILLKNEASSETDIEANSTTTVNDNYGGTFTGTMAFQHYLPFDAQTLYEIEDFTPDLQWWLEVGNPSIPKAVDNAFFTFKKTDIQCIGNSVDLKLKTSGRFEISTTASISSFECKLFIINTTGYSNNIVYEEILTDTGSGFDKIFNWNIDESFTIPLDVFNGEALSCFIGFRAVKTTSGDIDNVFIRHDNGAELKMQMYSLCDETPCKQFLINESFSRISEAITNDKIRVFSNYLGRTDAKPYQSLSDGDASLKSITKGLFIRRIDKVKENKPIFSVSFREMFDDINAIDNIGLSFEADNTRSGFTMARIENIKYFFNEDIILDLGEVKCTKRVNQSEIYGIFKFGYQKYEAEEFNGLDEFLTKREYRTNLSIKNPLERLCSFIASGYAIEITRRKGNTTSKDWRYDEDTFIVCLKRDAGNIIVEQGAIVDDENIIDPNTILNYRISPIRNAMRWIQEVFKGFKDLTKAKIIFTSGDGNYFAKGKYTGNSLEGIAISENETITTDSFADVNKSIPYCGAELDELQDIGLTYTQYKLIKLNPHGLIGYSVNGEQRYSWIQDLKYSVLNGSVDLLLIPKYQ